MSLGIGFFRLRRNPCDLRHYLREFQFSCKRRINSRGTLRRAPTLSQKITHLEGKVGLRLPR